MAPNRVSPPVANSRPSILCVDGNERMLEVIAKILAPLPVNCVTVSDPVAAIEEARRLRPRLVILNWQLPQMSGWELLCALRAEMQAAPPRVIILSAREGGFEQMLAQNVAGADAYLEKPLEIDRLRQEVSRLLEGPLSGNRPHD